MNILLDENISDLAINYLGIYSCNVRSIKSLGLASRGLPDSEVLKLAIRYDSVLITHNGKDFINSIPPNTELNHFGLIRLTKNLTRANCERYCQCIGENILSHNLHNSIWKVSFSEESGCHVNRRYSPNRNDA